MNRMFLKRPRIAGPFLLHGVTPRAMLVIMNISKITRFLAPALLLSFTVHAGLYKGLDEEGNVIYSDEPFDNSEKFTPPPITIVQPTKVAPREEVAEEEKKPETVYTTFSITSPKNEATIRNEPNVVVDMVLDPALTISEGHSIWLLLDGRPLIKKTKSLSLPIGRLDRGTHTLQAQVRNSAGKAVISTKKVKVFIHQTSVTTRAR